MNIPIKQLEQTNALYDPIVGEGPAGPLRALETYADFYRGGRSFELNKNRYLRSRPIETVGVNNNYRKNRLAAAYYTPHAGGIGANLCGTALQFPPTFQVRIGDGEKPDARADYYHGLNVNLDGRGNNPRSVTWTLLESIIKHRRAYIVVNFPNDADGTPSEDATFSPLSAKEVDDWQTDENGRYDWVRTHCVDLVRSTQFGPQDTERHTWTFYTDTATTEYIAERPIGATSFPSDAGEPVATGQPPVPHGLGEVPVYPIDVEDDFWVMDRLYSTANAYFNREASRSFAIDSGALSLPVVKTDKDVSSIVMAQGFCIKLGVGDDFKYASPDAGIYGAVKDDCEYLLNNLYSALNQMALTAGMQKENSRMSGTKAMADAASIKAFLLLLCSPIMAAYRKGLKAVQHYRGDDDLAIECLGMTEFDVQSIELEINRCLSFTSIPAVAKSPTLMRESVRKVARAYIWPDVDEETRGKIDKELAEASFDEPAPPGQLDKGMILEPTSQRPNGFAPGQLSQQYTKTAKAQAKAGAA